MNDDLFLSIQNIIDHSDKISFSIDGVTESIKDDLEKIAQILHIGYIISDFAVKFTGEVHVKTTLVYDSHKEYDKDNAYEYLFIINPEVNTVPSYLRTYPLKGYIWTPEEHEIVARLSKLIHIIYSRTHLALSLKHSYIYDAITEIPNTSGIFIYINNMNPSTRTNYSCIYSNIMDFKLINKTITSKRADLALIEYSHALLNFTKQINDGVVGRLGGDNFFSIIPNKHLKDYLKFIKNVNITIKDDDMAVPMNLTLKTRSGIYSIGPDENPSEYIHLAASAYNHAKHFLKEECCWFTPSMMNREIYLQQVKHSFDSAIENEEFIVYFQPKIDLSNMSLCGSEALVRWKKDDMIIPPIEFIPILEDDGRICKLDYYVLDKVCSLIKSWVSKGNNAVPVSVNFSKMHLQNHNLTSDILEIIDRHNLDHSLIEIEVTEQSDYASFDTLTSFINSMYDNGIKISIDDFGTGYSSINLLKNSHISTIKLDKSLLDELFSDNQNTAIIIKNIIRMANELNMDVIAEGVESKEYIDFLINAKCNMAQGYLFDKPMSASDFEYRLLHKAY
ncbi:MAG: GGDEF domain-containing phosphodiesterase [Lachnospiraceae bacterium]|nr:GGDEF domain-containing phosphodiesterase [Lachnospiraceae bacterium]